MRETVVALSLLTLACACAGGGGGDGGDGAKGAAAAGGAPAAGGGAATDPSGVGRVLDAGARFVRGGTGSATVRYQPRAKVVERAEVLATLAAISSDRTTLLFTRPGGTLAALAAGDVLVVKGLLARRVLAVEREGELLAVLTGPVSLGEVIRDGRIAVDAPLRFTAGTARAGPPARADAWARALELALPSAHAQDAGRRMVDLFEGVRGAGGTVLGPVLSGWRTTYTATPSPNRLDLALRMTKDVGGFVAKIDATGHLTDFDVSSRLDVQQGVVERLEVAHRRMNGVLNVTWQVAKDSPGRYTERDRIKLPGAIQVPLYQLLDGFPLFLEVGGAIIVQPAITGGKQYSHGSFRVTYDGTQHFQARPGTIDAEGNVTGDIVFLEDRTLSAAAPLGMVIALAAPRIELTIDPLKALDEIQGALSAQKLIAKAAGDADRWAARLTEKALGKEGAAALREATGGLSMGAAADAMKSNAAAYIQLISTSAMSSSGMSAITPCTRNDVKMTVSVGTTAQAFGQEVARADETIFERTLERIDPPGTKLCDLK